MCAGALGVLTAAAEDRPLVILVDDFQWLDAESAQILLFVARRLATEHIVMVLAVREEPDQSPRASDLPVLRLTGLSLGECAELATQLGSTDPLVGVGFAGGMDRGQSAHGGRAPQGRCRHS